MSNPLKTNEIRKDYKGYLKTLCRVIKNQNVQVIVLVIVVIATTWLIKDLTSSTKRGCFLNIADISKISNEDNILTEQDRKDEDRVPRKLDGVLVDSAASSTRPLALVIENHAESRPLSGLSQASVVYEMLVEGGITRFLALYDASSTAEEIGPIRSCRTYFLAIAEEYQALFGHVGGSPDCLDNLKRRVFDIYGLNQYFKDEYFWRNKRPAPHNVYTSTELLVKYLEDRGIDSNHEFEPWLYKDSETSSLEESVKEAENIVIDYSFESYKVEWKYEKEAGSYIRYLSGEIYQDVDESEIQAKNIIVQYVKTSLIDRIGRLRLRLEGRGEALVFQKGKVIAGYWRKGNRGERTKFYNEKDEEIGLNPGMTWIEVVPSDREVEYE